MLNGLGAVLTGVSAVVVTVTKFEEGAWLLVIALPLLVAAFEAVHRAYTRIGERLGLGRTPEPPHRDRSVVIVPVSNLSLLTCEAIAAYVRGVAGRGAVVAHAVRQDTDAVICPGRSWSGTRGGARRMGSVKSERAAVWEASTAAASGR
nr:hypothetical protein [Kutzneria buriramensis]WKX13901.1 hypothetical protein Q4V64_42805 [Kutzneria buriramensis]